MGFKLKRVFENNSFEKLIEDIQACFIDVADRNDVIFEQDDEVYCVSVSLPSKRESNRKDRSWDSNNFEDFLNAIENMKKITIELQTGLNKLKLEYPNMNYTFVLETNQNNIHDMQIEIALDIDDYLPENNN